MLIRIANNFISFIILALIFDESISSLITENKYFVKNGGTTENILDFNSSVVHLEGSEVKLNRLPTVQHDYLLDLPVEEDPDFVFKSDECRVEEWNKVRTNNITEVELHKEWIKRKTGKNSYLYGKTPSLLGAFAHKKQIVVTMTTENLYGKPVYCRYYDCRKREILDQFRSFVFPESVIHCPRRVGAEYISITRTLNEKAEYPIPIVSRVEGPKHYFTVCVAPLYGDEPKFLLLTEFFEYYKMQGATFFHVYVRNVSSYDRMLLDDYVRTGDIEVIKLHDHYWRKDWTWHNSEITDCHFRNKYFSKWTALVDLDEHIEMRSERLRRIVDFLDVATEPNIINLHFRVQWVIKHADAPARYFNEEQIRGEITFRRFRNASIFQNFFKQAKCIIRPERIAAMTIHDPVAHYFGVKGTLINETIGVVRHYRNVKNRVFPHGLATMLDSAPFSITDIAPWMKEKLTQIIVDRVRWIYEIADVPCDKKMYMYKLYETNVTC